MYSELDDIIKHIQKIKKYSISPTIKDIKRSTAINNSNDCLYIGSYYNNDRTKKIRIKPGNPDYHFR